MIGNQFKINKKIKLFKNTLKIKALVIYFAKLVFILLTTQY